MRFAPQTTALLKQEMQRPFPPRLMRDVYMGAGYCDHRNESIPVARACAFRALLERSRKHVYEHDLIVGSVRGLFAAHEITPEERHLARYTERFGERGWLQGRDHYAPDYRELLTLGLDGILQNAETSHRAHAGEPGKQAFLDACRIAITAFSEWVTAYGDASDDATIADICRHIAHRPPRTFREALQLVWLAHTAFATQGLFAMALGRMDQYLYPFYRQDVQAGLLCSEDARVLLANAFVKIGERRVYLGDDDVCNICVAGITPEGEDAVNPLSYDVLHAVEACNLPGPNLSARIHPLTPERFLEESLAVIGTGLGYPALMNDTVNLAALRRMGYDEASVRDYCFVGCIENFLPGMQPPWADGRLDTVKLLEYALHRGRDLLTGELAGLDVGDPRGWATMEDMLRAYERELTYGVAEYVSEVRLEHAKLNNAAYVNPFLSGLSACCVSRGLDICDGGAVYPSAHGMCAMGVGTIADSLCAIEHCVYQERSVSWAELLAALKSNYEGHEETRRRLLAAPKYGNDDDAADRYAVWFVRRISEEADRYRLTDGGRFYTAIASNTNSIWSGLQCAASPDGRLAAMPQSDAASPTYGRDRQGPTTTVLSVTKPDYTRIACGTVINQKFSPAMFRSQENLRRLAALVRVFMQRGGQEMQINAVSREVLADAMAHPEQYGDLIVRVSGFSAYFTQLDKRVQQDILSRTEQA